MRFTTTARRGLALVAAGTAATLLFAGCSPGSLGSSSGGGSADAVEITWLHGAENADVAAEQRLLPWGLANGVRLRRPVPEGAALTYDDLEAPGDTPCWRLRREYGLLLQPHAEATV